MKRGEVFDVGEATVHVGRGNHPGGVVVYRIEHEGKSVVYATDTEHYACVDPGARRARAGTPTSSSTTRSTRPRSTTAKVGWGHSTYVAGATLARAAGVGSYVLYHHDPMRSDAGVEEIEQKARELFPASVAAREGLVIDLRKGRGTGRAAA